MINIDCFFTCVVRRKCKTEIALELIQQEPDEGGSAAKIFAVVKDVLYVEVFGGGGHELHQTGRASW